jgi:hypothetical protein
MASYNGDNYQKAFVTKPSEKIEKGEFAGKKRIVIEHKVLDVALAVNDEILGPFIPADSIVTGAKVKINKSLGATGIFSLGYKANGVDVADLDAFIVSADAGGQAVLANPISTSAGIYKRFTKDTQIVLVCTEVMAGSVLDAVVTFEVEYSNE